MIVNNGEYIPVLRLSATVQDKLFRRQENGILHERRICNNDHYIMTHTLNDRQYPCTRRCKLSL